MSEDENQELECNFCSKKRTEVVKLVAGAGVFICDECINLCHDIIKEETKKPLREIESVIPSELKEFLESLSLESRAEAEQRRAESNQSVLNKAPLGIYIG